MLVSAKQSWRHCVCYCLSWTGDRRHLIVVIDDRILILTNVHRLVHVHYTCTHTHIFSITQYTYKKTTSNRSGVKFQLLTLTDKMRSFIRCDITSQMASKNINMIIIYRPISTRTKTNTGSDFSAALRSGEVRWECLCYSDTGLSTPWHARRHTSTPWTLSSSVSWENYRSMLWILRVSSQAW